MNPIETLLDAADGCPPLASLLTQWATTGRTDITASRIGRGIRNRHLAKARAIVGNATELYHQARRFESIVWPRWRTLSAPPETATALHRELFLARRGAPFPDSIRQYERIFRHSPGE